MNQQQNVIWVFAKWKQEQQVDKLIKQVLNPRKRIKINGRNDNGYEKEMVGNDIDNHNDFDTVPECCAGNK